MCGLCGFVSRKTLPKGRATLEKMLQAIRHRGPDSTDIRVEPDAGMAFARLAIIDLTPSGNQPMFDQDEQRCITFNGEIFNYLEIRAELEAKGHVFRSSSDTEVALRAYIEWGTDCFNRFRGMYAIVVRDKPERRVVAARDWFGIKPLYFLDAGATLYWSSEIKAFAAAGLPLSEDVETAAAFLQFGLLDHSDRTFFRNVWQLRPGERVVINSDLQVQRDRLFDLRQSAAETLLPSSEEERIQLFRDKLLETVRISLRSDVPVWFLLSGGLDSSALVAMTRHLDPECQLNALTVVHEQPDINELRYAEAVAAASRCRLEKVSIATGEWLQELDRMVHHQDEPCHSTTFVNHWFLMRKLHDLGVKVVISGQGVDEMLYGYVQLLMGYYFAEMLANGRFHRLVQEFAAHWRLLRNDWGLGAKRLLPLALKGMVPLRVARFVKSTVLTHSRALLKPEFRSKHPAPTRATDTPFPGPLNRAMHRMLTRESLPLILHYEDRNSMAFSIEQRVPYLDRDLASLVFAMPAEMKVRRGTSKWALREAMKGILPENVRTRTSKLGFNTPEREWLLSEEFASYLRDCRFHEVLDGTPVNAARFTEIERAFRETGHGNSSVLWRVYSYGLWKRKFRV